MDMNVSEENRSEDCLYMNIWAPSSIKNLKSESDQKAVLFFVHGGSFLNGNASRLETDGSVVAEKHDIIVVNIQYRLGIYGFGYLGRLREEKGRLNIFIHTFLLNYYSGKPIFRGSYRLQLTIHLS